MTQHIATATLATIIPCHNNADTLARAIVSALNQPQLDELLIVIDGSSDDSLSVAQQFTQSDARVRVIGLTDCGGPARARNVGAAVANSNILCFLDADDEHLPGYYAFAKATLATHPHLAGVKSGAHLVGLPENLRCDDNDPRYMTVLFSAPWNLAVHKPLFWLAGGFPQDEIFRGKLGGEDVALNTALRDIYPIGFVPQKFCRHNNRPDSHLEQYLRRTAVVDGAIVLTNISSEQQEASLLDAIRRHAARAAVNRRMTQK